MRWGGRPPKVRFTPIVLQNPAAFLRQNNCRVCTDSRFAFFLRCLGFGRAKIFGLIVGEAMLVATLGGVLGASAASAAFVRWDGLALSGRNRPT